MLFVNVYRLTGTCVLQTPINLMKVVFAPHPSSLLTHPHGYQAHHDCKILHPHFTESLHENLTHTCQMVSKMCCVHLFNFNHVKTQSTWPALRYKLNIAFLHLPYSSLKQYFRCLCSDVCGGYLGVRKFKEIIRDIKKMWKGWAEYGTNGGEKQLQGFGEETEAKRSLGRPESRWEINSDRGKGKVIPLQARFG